MSSVSDFWYNKLVFTFINYFHYPIWSLRLLSLTVIWCDTFVRWRRWKRSGWSVSCWIFMSARKKKIIKVSISLVCRDCLHIAVLVVIDIANSGGYELHMHILSFHKVVSLEAVAAHVSFKPWFNKQPLGCGAQLARMQSGGEIWKWTYLEANCLGDIQRAVVWRNVWEAKLRGGMSRFPCRITSYRITIAHNFQWKLWANIAAVSELIWLILTFFSTNELVQEN